MSSDKFLENSYPSWDYYGIHNGEDPFCDYENTFKAPMRSSKAFENIDEIMKDLHAGKYDHDNT